MATCTQCSEEYDYRREQLGYRTCLSCGDSKARKVTWCVTIPYSKGAYQVVSEADLKNLNPKRTGE